MKVKTSVTLPTTLLGRLDRVDKNRSAILERAAAQPTSRVWNEKRGTTKTSRSSNAVQKRLNREALDTLKYQRMP